MYRLECHLDRDSNLGNPDELCLDGTRWYIGDIGT
jgi:hypothetical protein